MAQEEKQLLLKDLCMRLPYGVKGKVYAETTNGEYDINGDMIFFNSPFDVVLDGINTSTEEIHVIAIGNEDTVDFIEDQQVDGAPYTLEEFKPYLRPMSSMTQDEIDAYFLELNKDEDLLLQAVNDKDPNHRIVGSDKTSTTNKFIMHFEIDWLNANHFDYRGLIEKGLALEAPKEMYKEE